jgi:hypothetical protein
MISFLFLIGISELVEWQEPPPSAETQESVEEIVAAALKVLKTRKLSWYDKEDALLDLMDVGPLGQDTLVRQLSKDLKKMESAYQKKRASLEKKFLSVATKIAQSRLNKKGLQKLDAVREKLLLASRSSGLTKDMVTTVCDPAVKEIVGILKITVTQVLDEEEDLSDALANIVEDLDVHCFVNEYWMDAHKDLLQAEEKWVKRARKRTLPAVSSGHHETMFLGLEALAFAAEIMPERDRAILASNELLFSKIQAEESVGIRDLNVLRIRAGIGALKIDVKLCEAGRGHSKDMVDHQFFAHQSVVKGKESPSDRARLAGTSGGAENISAGPGDGLGAIRSWWYSPGHHSNMMGGHGRTGLGRYQNHWTQMFGN